ncbi:sushi, von Willebrand factor type A, EGF and pentraxin domain-containing protein 1-like isoform X2 [Scleropages formosus]|uniref:sushi, von Willebrand factor type A, EGF and pentraxin domain-containing protein 1-like isoform X2 n=1 Tax=Scleropages formosus TaxID=113540 RepID=UPI0008785C70|nr:sushi, von Willebrand factor type A, EGF and pentraxin domain-containing protein 1-like isoform X2 [Scleropages formosus]
MRTLWGNVILLVSVFLLNDASAQTKLPKECGPPRNHPSAHPGNGYRAQTTSYPHSSRIRYQCALGYTALSGSLSIECRNGRWSAFTLRCARKLCGSAGDILNGYFEYEGEALFGDRAFAMCKEGYRLKGDRYMQCGNNGWEGKVPTCEQSTAEITCPSPAVENALRTDGDTLEFRAGDALGFTCQPGYDLHGSQKIICGPDEKWIPELPVCRPTRIAICSAPEDYNNTTRLEDEYQTQTKFFSGDEVQYKCAAGYVQESGSPSIVCQNGQWTRLTLMCQRKPCGSAGDILNGYFEYEGQSLFGDKAFAMCKEGYRLKGDRYMQCGNNGWEGKVPTCEQSTAEITCPSPAVENALRTDKDTLEFRAGDALGFTCQPGYDLHGSQKITCGPDGKWIPELPVCLPTGTAICSAPEDYNNTTRLEDEYQTQTKFFSGDEVQYKCAAGYVQESGSPSIVCQNGQWTRLTLMCQRYVPGSCGAPIPYPNMQLVEGHLTQQDLQEGSRLRYKCTMGYIRSGGTTSISYCKNGAWTHVDMECERKSCGSAGEILHGHYKYEGNLFGDKAFAVCNKGYQVVGFNYRQCLDMGWDGRDPVCEAVKCADPPEVVDGVWTGPIEGPFKYGTVITYQCRKGQLLGKSEMYCTFKGTWSSAPPQCKEVTCPNLVVPYAQKISGFGTRYQYKSAISFQCKKGYSLQGSSTVVCQQNGKWSKPPKCTSGENLYREGKMLHAWSSWRNSI